jgi:hypothetical protein
MRSFWGRSSAGRASRSQCEGREFDPPRLHQISRKALIFKAFFLAGRYRRRSGPTRDPNDRHAFLCRPPLLEPSRDLVLPMGGATDHAQLHGHIHSSRLARVGDHPPLFQSRADFTASALTRDKPRGLNPRQARAIFSAAFSEPGMSPPTSLTLATDMSARCDRARFRATAAREAHALLVLGIAKGWQARNSVRRASGTPSAPAPAGVRSA